MRISASDSQRIKERSSALVREEVVKQLTEGSYTRVTSVGDDMLERQRGYRESLRHSYSPSSRFAPSMIGCHPYTSEIMKPSMRRSSGALSFTVDL